LNVGSFTCINKKTLLIEDYFILQDVIAPILQVDIEESYDSAAKYSVLIQEIHLHSKM
jgi:hypothetical protein